VVTDRRLLGQVHGERFNLPIGHVKHASARVGRLGGLFGFGTLAIDLAVGDGRPMVLRGVVDPEPLATAINDAVTISGGGAPDGGPGEMGGHSPPDGGPGEISPPGGHSPPDGGPGEISPPPGGPEDR
jgi:hypothetical protein